MRAVRAVLFAFVAAASVGAQTPTTPKAITGRVVDEGGRPVPGAEVEIAPFRDELRAERRSTIADDEGRFVFDDLAETAYALRAAPAGYVADDGDFRPTYHPGDVATVRVVKGGVVTGTVTDADGEPAAGAFVRAQQVHGDGDALGSRRREYWQDYADDRGVYRIFGLPAGTYVVFSGGSVALSRTFTAYDDDAPTFHPSATRDGAARVEVRAGDEVRNVDIRHRGEPGRAVAGTLTGAGIGEGASAWVIVATPGGEVAVDAYVRCQGIPCAFEIAGVADGDYLVDARANGAQSPQRRVAVRGGAARGVDLQLVAFGTVAGRVRVDPPAADAPPKAERPVEESLVQLVPEATRLERAGGGFWPSPSTETPDRNGAFEHTTLAPGRYRVVVRPADEDWYVAAITMGEEAAGKPPADVARDGLAVRVGARVAGVAVRLARGAAAVRGRVEGAEGLRVYLVPADPKLAADAARHYEVEAEADGAFRIAHVAPGRYLVVASRRGARADVRRAAEAAGRTVDLAPGQRLDDLVVKAR